MRQRTRSLGLVVGLCLLAGQATAASAALEIYRPRGRPPAELAPLVSGILGPDGEAIADPASGHLILRGDPSALAEALEVLERLDRPPATYSVESVITTLRALRQLGIEVGGWVDAGWVRVGTARGARGLELWVHPLREEGELRLHSRLTVLEGRPAEIWTGSDAFEPVLTSYREGNRVVTRSATHLVSARSGFQVTARGLPDGRVDLEIAPVAEEHGAVGITHAGLATHVSVSSGDLVVLGLTGRSESRAAVGGLGSLERSDSREERLFVVSVERIDPELR